jgi:AcrR family transcriptional regulator
MSRDGKLSFYKRTFMKISPEKQERVLSVAISEFASQGYSAASIKSIAEKAGISIGSLYSYFHSKEDLFLAVVEKGHDILRETLAELRPEEGTVFEVIERLLNITYDYGQSYTDFCKIYIDLSTEALSAISERLTENTEADFAGFYPRLLERAKERGEVRPDLDTAMASFFLDNLVVMLQFSLTSSYYGARMRLFLGSDYSPDRGRVIAALMRLVREALAP